MIPLNRSILVVDDEAIIAQLWSVQMELIGLEVCGLAATADDAVQLAQAHRPAVILMDVRLRGEKDGVDAALAIHKSVGSRIIFITGSQDPQTMKRIALDHAVAVLVKPVSEHLLNTTVIAALGEGGMLPPV